MDSEATRCHTARRFKGIPRAREALPFAVEILSRLANFWPVQHTLRLAEMVAQPAYLADNAIAEACPEYTRKHWKDISDQETKYETVVAPELLKRNIDWDTLDIATLTNQPEPRLFWGGPGSYSYPLHSDVADGDVFFEVHSGCKAVVLLPMEARHRLTRINVPGFEFLKTVAFVEDLHRNPPPDGVTGWRGVVRPNELLYMPGELLHDVRNTCKKTVSICRRPWRASLARSIFWQRLKSLMLLKETHPEKFDNEL